MKRAAIGLAAGLLIVLGVVVFSLVRKSPQAEVVPEPVSPPEAVLADATTDALRVILDGNASYEDRMMAIMKVDRELAPEEVTQLHELVKTKGVHSAIRSDVLSLLKKQKSRPAGLGADLVAMWRDKAEDPKWRDFCLQHIADVNRYDPGDAALLEGTLLDAAKDEEGGFSGTAMLSLERLGKERPRLAEEVRRMAREAVLSDKMDKEKVVTALQVARAAGDVSVLAKARKLAADTGTLVRLRMSAVGTIGELGEKKDIALLEGLCEDKESRVRRVAKYNLRRLKRKHSPEQPAQDAR